MLFGDRNNATVRVLRIASYNIKSRIYNFKDVKNIFLKKASYITKTSPFVVGQGRKQEIYNFLCDNIYFLYTEYFDKQKINGRQSNLQQDEFLYFLKWRLGVLGRFMRQFSIDRLKQEEFFNFLIYELSDYSLIVKLARLFEYKTEYNLQDIKRYYLNCCKFKQPDIKLLKYLQTLYKVVDPLDNDVLTDNKLKYKLAKFLSSIYNIPTDIILTYTKTINKFLKYVKARLGKNSNTNNLEELLASIKPKLETYKQQENNLHLNIDSLVTGKEIKKTIIMKATSLADIGIELK